MIINIKNRRVALDLSGKHYSEKFIKNRLTELGAKVVPYGKHSILFTTEKSEGFIMSTIRKGGRVYTETMLYELLGISVKAQPPTETAETLLQQNRLQVRTNFPHDLEMTSFGLSNDGRYLAVGEDCGVGYAPTGRLVIWDAVTGCVVNTVEEVPFGVAGGRMEMPKGVQWSPDDNLIGISFNTNEIGFVKPFEVGQEIKFDAHVYAAGHCLPWRFGYTGLTVLVGTHSDHVGRTFGGTIAQPSELTSFVQEAIELKNQEGAPELAIFDEMQWTEEHIIVGYSKYEHICYAINMQKMDAARLLWKVSASGCMFHPNGKEMVVKLDDAEIVVRIKTGRIIHQFEPTDLAYAYRDVVSKNIAVGIEELPPQQLKGTYLQNYQPQGLRYANFVKGFYSRDGVYFVGFFSKEIKIYKNYRLQGCIEKQLLDERSYEEVDFHSVAISADSQQLILLTAEEKIEIWHIPTLTKIRTLPFGGYQGIFSAAGNRIIAASKERLTFFKEDGSVIADHFLYDFPITDPFFPQYPRFIYGEGKHKKYGYVVNNVVIADEIPEDKVHLVLDGRWVKPFDWANIPVFKDFRTAALEVPDLLGEEAVALFKDFEEQAAR